MEHMTSHNSRLPKKREKHRTPVPQMSADNNIRKEQSKPPTITTSLNELSDVLTAGLKPQKYLREIQNRHNNQPSMLNMDTRYVRNVSIGLGLRQVGPHCALYVPIVRYHPYSNNTVNKREERPRTRSENNDETAAGPSTSHQIVRHEDYSLAELAEISLKKSKSMENIVAECTVHLEEDKRPEMEIVSDFIERLKVD